MARRSGRDVLASHGRSIWPIAVVWIVLLSAIVGAQVVAVRFPERDTRAPHRHERRVPIGTSSISGTVIASDTGLPLADARVILSGVVTCNAPGSSAGTSGTEDTWLVRTVMTDPHGYFSFPRLPAGAFRINVDPEDDHYFEANYGERRVGGEGKHIPLADGQVVSIQVPLSRGAAITGVVLGPTGIPLRRVSVAAFQIDRSSGFPQLERKADAETDDRGVYRIFGLPPASYLVAALPDASTWGPKRRDEEADHLERTIASATIAYPPAFGRPAMITVPETPRSESSGRTWSYLPTYAPSTLSPSHATIVTIGANEERAVDISAQAVEATTIRGVVSTPLEAGMGANVWLVNDDSFGVLPSSQMVRTDSDGEFAFGGIAPGNYTVLVEAFVAEPRMTLVNGSFVRWRSAELSGAQKMWGMARMTIAGGPTAHVNVSLQPTRSISGIVVFNGQSPSDFTHQALTVYARRAKQGQQIHFPDGSPNATVGPDGRFTITGVPGGRYILQLNVQAKSSMVGGQDTLDFPLEFSGDHDLTNVVLTLNDRPTLLSGTLTDASGKPVFDYVVIAAATDSRYWHPDTRRVERSFLEPSGRFTFSGLPAGQYQISVVPELEPGALHDPEFLRAIAHTSVTVTIPDGGRVVQNLRVK